jgi:tetratricopeptide (TPR) repeat protein
VSRADIHTAKGDSDKALADYGEAIRLEPKNAGFRSGRADIYLKLGDRDKALADYSEAIQLDPHSAWAFTSRGNLYDSQGEQDKALADFSEAIRLDPRGAWAYAVRGRTYAAKGDFDKGLADCNEAIRLDPKLVHAYLCRANAYKAQGNSDKALDDLNQAVQIDPQYSWAYGDRGRIFEDRGDLERALADYSEAIRLNPAPPCGARAARADLYVRKGEFDKAVADYDQMGELGRGDWWHYKRKAEAHFQLKHYDKALESIAKAVELNPGDGSNLWWIPPAEVAKCPDERLRQGFLALADKAIETTQGGAQAHMARALLYDAFGRGDEARVDFDKALQLDPTQPLFWAWRASFHAQHARWNETVTDFSKLIELQPECMDCWYQRCLARLGGGQVDEYRRDCREMLQRFGQTDKAGDRYWVAWACVLAPDATTDWATAVGLAEKTLQNDPQSATYLNTFGAVLYRAGRYDEALTRLSEAAALFQEPSEAIKSPPASPWFFLAMTQHRLGHAEEAKQWLDKAVTRTDIIFAEADRGTADLSWDRRLTLKLLRDEAAALLGVTLPTVEPAPAPAAKEEEAKEPSKSTPAPEAAKEEETSHK